ncbi:helix-turn-helix domain-containing protein [Vibrio injensis]|uniref:helix-turn-helix domain-containing protein n=1 Tax=Vibrio injensis TaxID=1307414 RepID=UPI000934CA59|nr:helix-turn-helix domain-containing protein [Vibrio injensis]
MSTDKSTNEDHRFEEVMRRVLEVVGGSSQRQAAQALGMSAGDLGNRKARAKLPWDQLYEFARSHSVSVDWLLTGEGEMYRPGADPKPTMANFLARIQPERERLGLSRAELASRLGVPEQQVADWETGAGRLTAGDMVALEQIGLNLKSPAGDLYRTPPGGLSKAQQMLLKLIGELSEPEREALLKDAESRQAIKQVQAMQQQMEALRAELDAMKKNLE